MSRMSRSRFRLFGLVVGALLSTLAFLAWQSSGPSAPETAETANGHPDAALGARAPDPALIEAETDRLVAFLKQSRAKAKAQVDALEAELRTGLSALERDPSNQTLAEKVAALAHELELASHTLARLDKAKRPVQEPELGGSCVFWLPGQLKATRQQ